MSLTAQQLEVRKQGLGASEIPAILGKHPYKTPLDVLLEKRGEAPPFEGNEYTEAGHDFEIALRHNYAKRNGVFVVVAGTEQHPKFPTHLATPDGLVYPADPGTLPPDTEPLRGWEAKWHSETSARWQLLDLYGEPGSDEVPEWEALQCHWGMHVCDLDEWHLTACIGLPTDYVIRRDLELEEMLCEAADRWWDRHIIQGHDIDPDGSGSWDAYLAHAYPKHLSDKLRPATAEELEIAEQLRRARIAKNAAVAEETRLKQEMQLRIGAEPGVEIDLGDGPRKITWKRAKDSRVTNWEAVAAELRTIAELQGIDPTEIIDRHTETRMGSRRFLVATSWSARRTSTACWTCGSPE